MILENKQNQKDEENNASSSRIGGYPSFEHQDPPLLPIAHRHVKV